MDNTFYKPHAFGLEIIRKLLKSRGLRFNDLLIEDLESEHMNYHLKKLISFGYVEKEGTKYSLTNKGKDYVGMLDDNKEIVEKQPKVSVVLNVVRKNGKGEYEHLLSRRLIQPYINKVGRLSGKMRFGESVIEAALRELYEETGLVADVKDCRVIQVYHKLRNSDKGEPIQDNIFFICDMKNVHGDFIPKTPVQENIWVTKREFETSKDIDPFDDMNLQDHIDPDLPWLKESSGTAQGY